MIANIIASVARITGQAGSAKQYSTTFSVTENPLSEGSAWTQGGAVGLDWNNVRSANAHAYGTQTGAVAPPYNDSIACLSGFGPNQAVQAVIHRSGSIVGLETELLLRYQITAHAARGYEVDLVGGSGNMYFVRWNGAQNDFTVIGGPITTNVSMADGDVWYADIVGTTVTVKCNGTTVYTHNVSGDVGGYWSGGNPGIGAWNENNDGSASSPNFGWKSFTAASL